MKNFNLKNYTTFKIGSEPKDFFIVKNEKELINILNSINNKFFILGGGSNLLVSDNVDEYSIIKMENKGIAIKENIIEVESGELFQVVINTMIDNNLSGLEWGAGIPGTIGGSIFGNSGSFGGEIKDSIENVEVLDTETKEKKILNNNECNFFYRNSIFKKNQNKYIILRAIFKLNKVDSNIIREIYNKNLETKKNTQPITKHSAGCIFKNVYYDVDNKKLLNFIEKYKENNIFKERKQIPVAFLIDKLGLKGFNINDAEISNIHANFIVNNGNADYRDVKELIEIIKTKFLDTFDLKIEEEIEEI